MPCHHKLRLIALCLTAACTLLLGPIADAGYAGQIGPDGMIVSRCNIGQTTAWDRQANLLVDLALPAIVSVLTFAGAIGAFIGYSRSSRKAEIRKTGRRLLGAAVGVMLALSVSSFAVCLAIVAMHLQT